MQNNKSDFSVAELKRFDLEHAASKLDQCGYFLPAEADIKSRSDSFVAHWKFRSAFCLYDKLYRKVFIFESPSEGIAPQGSHAKIKVCWPSLLDGTVGLNLVLEGRLLAIADHPEDADTKWIVFGMVRYGFTTY